MSFCENEFRTRSLVDVDDSVARQRCLGNVRFIAELGRLGQVPEKILHDCIRKLLSNRSRPNDDAIGHSEAAPGHRVVGDPGIGATLILIALIL